MNWLQLTGLQALRAIIDSVWPGGNDGTYGPVKWIEAVSNLRLPPKANKRLQELMDRNNEGQLSASERRELEGLVELSERLSLVRAEALHLPGKSPQ